tara:strand:- start:1839 stop:2396 length:558 start_codon:yes stop_codon:yes gene_type:complete
MNAISIPNFYNISDSDKNILIEDIFYSKGLHDNKEYDYYDPTIGGVNENFLVVRDRAKILKKMYNKMLSACESLFERIELSDNNSDKCWSLCTNKDYWKSVPHNHIRTSTINTVYYLQVPKIDNQFCGMIRFLIDGKWEDYQPKSNELIIMPNDLVHDTTFHDTEEWRISLNFEIITKNELQLKQ